MKKENPIKVIRRSSFSISNKMLPTVQIGDGNDVGSDQNNRSDDELMKIFDITKYCLSFFVLFFPSSRADLEVMVIRTVQNVIWPTVEDLFRKVVKEEIKSEVKKFLTSMNQNPENETSTSESRSLKLEFDNKVSHQMLTGKEIKGEDCRYIKIALVDCLTGQVVNSGPKASAEVEILVLAGDFSGDNWTLEEFQSKIVREEGKNPSLAGNVRLKLNKGVGFLHNIRFRHGSKWTRMGEFRLGARFVDPFDGTRVKEGKTESFLVKDCRGENYKKHDVLSLSDDVWRLKNIHRGGPVHQRLRAENIKSLLDFLRLLYTNPERLQKILGMGTKMTVTVDHARTCTIDETAYFYSDPSCQQNTGVVFNVVGQVQGRLLEYQYVRTVNLSESQKVVAHELVVSAFANLNDVVPYINETSLLQSCSHLPNASSIPSNPVNIDNPIGHNIEHDSTQPSMSCAATTVLVVNSQGFTCGVDDFEVVSEDNHIEFIVDQSGSVAGQGNYSQTSSFNPEHIVRDEAGNHHGFVNDHCINEQIAAATGGFLVGEQSVSILTVRKRWKITFTVLSILRYWRLNKQEHCRFSRNHVQKKPRFCC